MCLKTIAWNKVRKYAKRKTCDYIDMCEGHVVNRTGNVITYRVITTVVVSEGVVPPSHPT